MNNSRKIFALCILFVSLAISGVSQQYLKQIINKGVLKVGTTGNQPPFTMTDTAGKIIGYEIELAEMLANKMGVQLKIVKLPFSELLSSLDKGEIDMVMSGMTITVKRNLKSVFVGPYLISGKSVLTRSTLFSEVDESDDLNNKSVKIGVLQGSTSELYVKEEMPNASLTLCKDYDSCIKLLEEGKINIMVADYPICAYTVLVHPEKGLITIDQPLTIEPIGVAMPTDAAHFINLVENYFNQLLITGTLDEMELYWFDSGEWVERVKEK